MTLVGLEFVARNRANAEMNRFGNSLRRMGRQMLLMAGVGGGLYVLKRGFDAVINSASDAQEIGAKFDVVFGKLTGEARKWATDFGDSVGRATQDVEQWMAGLQDTFVPLGIARNEAAELSKSLVTLAVDVASFNNAADATVIRDFTSALVGNHETVRKYGVIISESAMKQEALRRGLNKTYSEFTDLEKVQLRYSLIQSGTTDAQGDALRTADSYANQVKRLSANFTELKTSIGEEALPAMTEFVGLLNNNSDVISKTLVRPLQSVSELIKISGAVQELINAQGGISRPGSPARRHLETIKKGLGLPPVGDLVIPPRRVQALAEMNARVRRIKQWQAGEHFDVAEGFLDSFPTATGGEEFQFSAARKRMMALQQTVDFEKKLVGRIGEPLKHARMMQEYYNKALDEYGGNVRMAEEATAKFAVSLKELERYESLAKIADDIGDAFGSAFERMVMDGEKARDVMKALARDIAGSVLRNLVTRPIAAGLSAGIGGLFGIEPVEGSFQHGGIIPKTGLYQMHANERVFNPAAGGPTVIINNNSGVPLNAGRPQLDGDRIIIQLESAMADRIGRGAGALAPLLGR